MLYTGREELNDASIKPRCTRVLVVRDWYWKNERLPSPLSWLFPGVNVLYCNELRWKSDGLKRRFGNWGDRQVLQNIMYSLGRREYHVSGGRRSSSSNRSGARSNSGWRCRWEAGIDGWLREPNCTGTLIDWRVDLETEKTCRSSRISNKGYEISRPHVLRKYRCWALGGHPRPKRRRNSAWIMVCSKSVTWDLGLFSLTEQVMEDHNFSWECLSLKNSVVGKCPLKDSSED